MLAGHVGAALGLSHLERRLSLGVLLLAALLLDVLLWLFVLLGLERVTIPADYAARHYLTFVFPWSHGLVASVFWSALAGGAAWLLTSRWRTGRGRAAFVVAAAVFSHWLLDALVHLPELPLAGADSPRLGLALWNVMPAALGLEAIVTFAGLALYLRRSTIGRARAGSLCVLVLVVLALTIAGGTVAAPPPGPRQVAASSLMALVLIIAIGAWLARAPRGREAPTAVTLLVVLAVLAPTLACSRARQLPPSAGSAAAGDGRGGHRPLPALEELRGLPSDGGPDWNRLVFEQSPYLLQHAGNPVDWYPWGEEAFATAAAQDKPIFLSIGYATCHWCHVMERECFEDPEVAALLNAEFICIKVDREERPDVDRIYISVTEAMTGGAGWPMTIVMTPDRKPFFAGTYFPKRGSMGRPGLMEILPQLATAWRSDRAGILRAADQSVEFLRQQDVAAAGGVPGGDALDRAYEQLAQAFDANHGGFGQAPKFPVPHNLRFLLRYAQRSEQAHAQEMVETTLDAMRRGGIWDHLGYGFHRYSTDDRWLVPHFEKMLYDQALLAMAYLESYQATGRVADAQTAREIFTYVLRDMSVPEGGFASAEDADSEGEEGKFYLWTPAQVGAALGTQEGELFDRVYDVRASSNSPQRGGAPERGDSEEHGVARGRGEVQERDGNLAPSILHLARPIGEWADTLGVPTTQLQQRLERARQKLLLARQRRVRPLRDDKVLADWNGLMIAALSMGARVLDEPEYAQAARRAADFVFTHLRNERGQLLKRYRAGAAGLAATLDDYAFMLWGLLELYEATFDLRDLEAAVGLAHDMIRDYGDPAAGGFFLSGAAREDLLVRSKVGDDAAIPSGNSVAALVLLRLSRMTGEPAFARAADGVFKAFAPSVQRNPAGHSQMLVALDFALGPSYEVVIAGAPGAADARVMLRALEQRFLPNKVVLLRPDGPDAARLATLAEFTQSQSSLGGRATAYVCRDFACRAPTTDPQQMLAALAPTAGGRPAPRSAGPRR